VTGPILVSPVNISEGRRPEVIGRIAAAAETTGVHVLDVHSDPDHNRSVLTVAGPAEALVPALLEATAEAVGRIDISRHEGVHPRLGAVDVVPFVPLRPQDRPAALDAALRFAESVFDHLGVPCFFYEAAAGGRTLPEVRRRAFKGLPPDLPRDHASGPHPLAGAIAVGVRDLLVAFNVDLAGDDLSAARSIAAEVRRLDGVRALGLALPSRHQTQVSMNLVEPLVTGVGDAFGAVAALAAEAGVGVAGSELVGLAPRGSLPENIARLGLARPPKVLEDELAHAFGAGAALLAEKHP